MATRKVKLTAAEKKEKQIRIDFVIERTRRLIAESQIADPNARRNWTEMRQEAFNLCKELATEGKFNE